MRRIKEFFSYLTYSVPPISQRVLWFRQQRIRLQCRRPRFNPWLSPLKDGMTTHSSILGWRIPMDRGAGRATVHGVAESDTTEQLSTAHTQNTHNFPGGLVVKNLPANAGDSGEVNLIPVSGRSLGVRNGNPFQYSCLENFMGRGA